VQSRRTFFVEIKVRLNTCRQFDVARIDPGRGCRALFSVEHGDLEPSMLQVVARGALFLPTIMHRRVIPVDLRGRVANLFDVETWHLRPGGDKQDTGGDRLHKSNKHRMPHATEQAGRHGRNPQSSSRYHDCVGGA
jgi:hypothetical protein